MRGKISSIYDLINVSNVHIYRNVLHDTKSTLTVTNTNNGDIVFRLYINDVNKIITFISTTEIVYINLKDDFLENILFIINQARYDGEWEFTFKLVASPKYVKPVIILTGFKVPQIPSKYECYINWLEKSMLDIGVKLSIGRFETKTPNGVLVSRWSRIVS